MADIIAGRFELIEPLAKGGSGAVWRAVDHKGNHECAAKVLRQRDSADLLRFVREQSVKLDHPHVVAPYGWAAEDEHVVIAMRLVSGGTLEAALGDNGAVSGGVAEEVLWQLLQALRFVHARGWIHRDVKPANILLEPTGTGRPWIRLADFGIAVRTEDTRLTHTGTVVGTPGYLPQEAYGPAEPAATVDLYAAGVSAVRLVVPGVDLSVPLRPSDATGLFPDSVLLSRYVPGLLSADPERRVSAAHDAIRELGRREPERARAPALTAAGEPFEVFDILAPTTERELTVVRDAAVLPGAGDVPTAPIAWRPVTRSREPATQPLLVSRDAGDPLEPFAPAPSDATARPPADTLTEGPGTIGSDVAEGPAGGLPPSPGTGGTHPGVRDPVEPARKPTPRKRRRFRAWPVAALLAGALAVAVGFFWVGPWLTAWLGNDPTGTPVPTTTTGPATAPASPQPPGSGVADPDVALTPVCTDQEDGTVSCVLSP